MRKGRDRGKLETWDGHPGFMATRLLTYPMVLCAAPDYLTRLGVTQAPAAAPVTT